MDIRRFRIFQKAAEQQSFTKAAQSLYMTCLLYTSRCV